MNIEAFHTFRINGANDFQDWAWPPILVEHPHWGQPSPFWPKPWKHFNFALEEVRQYKLAVIREVAENDERVVVKKLEIYVDYQ